MGRWATWATGGPAFWSLRDTRPGKHTKSYWTWPIYSWFTHKKMWFFNSYVSLPEAIPRLGFCFVLDARLVHMVFWRKTHGKPIDLRVHLKKNPPQLDTWKFLIFCRQPTDSPAKGWRGCRGPTYWQMRSLGAHFSIQETQISCWECNSMCILCIWLVVWNIFFFPILGIIIPIE